jgi:ABC-type uncharacterized transport system substrate-binding protein
VKRREFIALVGGAAACPLAARAQQPAVPVIGFLSFAALGNHKNDLEGFRQGLRENNHTEGRTLVIEERYADGKVERSLELITDLVQRNVTMFVTPGPSAALAIRRQTTRVPVVSVALPSSSSYPDLFASLARPGGNVTGFSHIGPELAPKRVELLREMIPSLRSLAILYAATDPLYKAWAAETERAAQAQGLKAIMLGLTAPSTKELRSLVDAAGRAGASGLFIVRDFITEVLREDIVQMAKEARIAAISEVFRRGGRAFIVRRQPPRFVPPSSWLCR